MIAAIVALAMAVADGGADRGPYSSPFPRADQIAIATIGSRAGPKCEAPPQAVRDIETVSKFGENRRAHGSTIVDPDAASEYIESTRRITDFSRSVASLADRFVDKNGTGGRDARCAMQWMSAWADQDALLGKVNQTGQAVRKWELASLAASYLKIRSAAQDPEQSSTVRRWLRRVAIEVRRDYSRDLSQDSRSNNHLNWAAWSVMAAAIASDDAELFDWSIDRFRFAMAQIGSDGTLPLELKRRQLALSYHNFALGPLIMLREGATANGVSLTREEERRLQSLIDLVLTGLENPASVGAKAGFAQDGEISVSHLAWLEPYYARTADPRAAEYLEEHRPMTFTRLGGNLTALFRK